MSRARAELYLSAPPWDSAPDNPQGEREAPVAAERPLNLTVFPEVSLLGGPSRLAWTTEPGLEATQVDDGKCHSLIILPPTPHRLL